MILDRHLIAQAQQRSTGQTVHALANLLAIYMGFESARATRPATEHMAAVERRIRIFCQTGRVDH